MWFAGFSPSTTDQSLAHTVRSSQQEESIIICADKERDHLWMAQPPLLKNTGESAEPRHL